MPATSTDLARRRLLGLLPAAVLARAAEAANGDQVVIAWPADVPGWNPHRGGDALAQSVWRMVYDPLIGHDPRQALIPHLATAWEEAPDGSSLALVLRSDAIWHDGRPLTAAAVREALHDRPPPGIPEVAAIDRAAPDRLVLHFATPLRDAARRLAFPGSFALPPPDAGAPLGTGPYRVAEHHPGARLVLERSPHHWGPRPPLGRVVLEVQPHAAQRLASLRSGRADLALDLPPHDLAHLAEDGRLAGEINPVARLVLLTLRPHGAFAAANVRLAAHHAIDKALLSAAFYGAAAPALAAPALPGTDGVADDLALAFDPHQALNLLDDTGIGPGSPVPVRLASTRGAFPGDWDIARAVAAMWRTVGLAATPVPVAAAETLPDAAAAGAEAVLRCIALDGAPADADRVGAWRRPGTPWAGNALADLAAGLDDPVAERRAEAWRDLNRAAVLRGAVIPLLQGVQTLARRRDLGYQGYAGGYVLAQTMQWV